MWLVPCFSLGIPPPTSSPTHEKALVPPPIYQDTRERKKFKAVIEEPHILANSIDIPQKKSKLIDDTAYGLDYHSYHPYAQFYAHQLRQQHQHQLSAFRPWTPLTPKHLAHLTYSNVPGLPYLSQEPPILQNPERVVRMSECERFERTFQPNVALAPRRVNGLSKELSPRDRIITTDIPIKIERVTSPPENLAGTSPELRVTSPAADGAPVSPEQMSGSNEITSSTSPVPLTNNQVTTNGVSSSPPRSAPDIHLHHNNHQVTGVTATSVVLKNGGPGVLGGNPEFELSTDTDDDSLTGEADSSITGTPWDIGAVAEALKDVAPTDRDRVLHIIKFLVQENMQLRQCTAENARLLRQKDDQIAELLLEQQRRQLPPPPPPPPEPLKAVMMVVKNEPTPPDVVASKTTEVIMKPLKKSARRSPEDTVVVMPPNKRYTLSAAVAAAEDIPDPPKDSIKRVEMVNGVGGEHKVRENGMAIQCKDSG
ncbi:hypothetical protein DMENIID0001_039020 [Sergentomyia squamirostris]